VLDYSLKQYKFHFFTCLVDKSNPYFIVYNKLGMDSNIFVK
jgi:hypothetical protein